MRKLLLINQHSSNHGDEAAARAFLSRLANFPAEYSIIYNASGEKFELDLPVKFSSVIPTGKISLFQKFQIILSLIFPVWVSKYIFTGDVKREYGLIENSDLVISMPGGANLGLYEDWRYLWRIRVAQSLAKRTAIYSTSIGPFRDNHFKKLAFEVLRSSDWVSLRDAASIRYGRSGGVDFEESIDTAFLAQEFADTTWQGRDLSDFGVTFAPDSYCVFVPNNLKTGHKTFRSVPKEHLDALYLALLNKSLAAGMNIVMLPQLFSNGNDRNYFVELAQKSDDPSRIFVAAEDILSDHQQLIISKARFVVGARYHSIIFSINMRTPFLCLSYENKMRYTLERLKRPEMGIDLTQLAENASHEDMIRSGTAIIDKLVTGKIAPADAGKALAIAEATYDKFENRFLNTL